MKTEALPSNAEILIVGGVAAGASAAARMRRLSESARITLIERGPDVSFANCGLPYHIGGEIADRGRLVVQTPESLERLLNIQVLTGTEAIAIDRERKMLTVRGPGAGAGRELPYDRLVLAPGASPLRPPLPGIGHERIFTLRTLQDMDRIKSVVEASRSALVIGAGFIGLEMAEQLHRIGKSVTLVEAVDQVLPPLDPDMAAPVAQRLRAEGIRLVLNDPIASFEDDNGALVAGLKSGQKIGADFVILAIGVRPENTLAAGAGLELGARGAIKVNAYMQTSDPSIYAAGDAVESFDRLSGAPMQLALGGPANRQGRLIADHIFRPESARPYPGHVGTAIVRVFDLSAGLTGWTEKRLKQAGKPYRASVVTDFQHASYFPGAVPLTVKLLWEPENGRLLGGQVVGSDGVDKRVDVLATALVGKLTIDQLADLELAYAPPFGSARDVINTAGFAARNARDTLSQPSAGWPADRRILDVRPTALAALTPIPDAVNIPPAELRGRLGELDKNARWLTVCELGKTSYFAERILAQAGFEVASLAGGLRMHPLEKPEADARAPDETAARGAPAEKEAPERPATTTLDCTGLACPGPLMRVKAACETLPENGELVVTASDPGFAADVAAFARSTGIALLKVDRAKGLITARLRRTAIREDAASADAPVREALPADARRKGASLVVFSGEMDKVMAALVIANGAAALGGKVTIFFTFWGINALRREQAATVAGKSLLDRAFGRMLPRGLGRLPLSKLNFFGVGRRLMQANMAAKNLPNLSGLLGSARLSGVRLVACAMSMEAMGIRSEELIDGVELGGVADFLDSAERSGTNLFI